MRVSFLCAVVLFSTLVMGQTITEQGYTGGTAALGGCTGLNATDVTTVNIGQCYQSDVNASIWINDCWSNGVVSISQFNGSTTCDPKFASGLQTAFVNVVGQTLVTSSYCNIQTSPVVAYSTFQCSAVTPTPAWAVKVNIFSVAGGAKDCSGAPILTQDALPTGVCTQLTGTGVGAGNNPLYVLANCQNSLVSAVVYTTSNCSVPFSNGTVVPQTVTALGPYAQINATSAVNKPIGAPGSACAFPNPQAYLSFTCVATTPATTQPPTTPATTQPPTTPAPTAPPKNGTATALTAGLAVAILPILATVL